MMTCPWSSSCHSGGGGVTAAKPSQRAKSSSTMNAPARRQMSSTSPRRCAASTLPSGLAYVGWMTSSRADVRANASRSSSGRIPSRSPGTGMGMCPALRATASAPG